MAKYNKWEYQDKEDKQIDPVRARDLMVECFYSAQKDKFKALKEKAGIPSSDKDVYDSIVVMVRLAFSEIGGDFKDPNKDNLLKVLDFLVSRETIWGTPKDVVDHNKTLMLKIINRVK